MSEEAMNARAYDDHRILMLAWKRLHPGYTYREYIEAVMRIAREVGL